MKNFDSCISCNHEHNWSVDEDKSNKLSFYKAVCESCHKKLRDNRFSEDWSMTMSNRFEKLLSGKN